MPDPSGQPWTRRYARGRQASPDTSHMRLSDADRTAAADRLSHHYGDGRLDQAEFDERLDAVMKAKTQADLTGLFHDLPGLEPTPAPPPAPAPPRRRPGFLRRAALLVFLVVVAAVVLRAVAHPFPFFFFPFVIPIPWLVIGFIVFLCLRRRA